MALWIDVDINDVLELEDGTMISVEHKSGRRARLKISGDSKVVLRRNGKLSPPPDEVKRDGAAA